MNPNDASPESPAQRALARMVRMLLPDRAQSEKAIADALRAARREKLPEDPWELLRFAKADLATQLKQLVPPNFVLALIDDLAAEIDRRPRTGTARPPASVRARSLPKVAPPRMLSVRGVSKKQHSIRPTVAEAGDPVPIPESDAGPSVVLVDIDRLARATLARALVKAQFDVSVFDAIPQVLGALRGRGGVVIVILDVKAVDIESIEALVEAHPGLRVVARTDATPRVAKSVLAAAGVSMFSTVPKTASTADIIDSMRTLLSPPSPNDPVRRGASASPVSRGRGRSKP